MSPWLFLDAKELGCVNQTCSWSMKLVDERTSRFDFTPACIVPEGVSDVGQMPSPPEVSNARPEEEPLEIGATEMRNIIDTVVAKVVLLPKWQKVPSKALEEEVGTLKAMYEDSDGTLYSRSQALALMERTGLNCGDLASRCNG